MPELKPEGFVLKTATWQQRPIIIVAANDDAGTLNGTYELLERLGHHLPFDRRHRACAPDVLSCPDLEFGHSHRVHTPRLPAHAVLRQRFPAFSWSDYKSFIDQMARMKCNYLQIWWFAYAPWNKFAVRGETKWIGDVSAKESGYSRLGLRRLRVTHHR
jgi:hypothetical protein